MARDIALREQLTGIVEQITDTTGSDTKIDQKVAFGPVFEEYMRDNTWMSLMDWTYNDIQRKVYKTNHSKLIKETTADFDPLSKVSGDSTKPAVVLISLDNEKEVAAAWYDRDFQESNVLQGVGQRLIDEVMVTGEDITDDAIAEAFGLAADASSVAAAELDIDAMEITADNGQLVFEAIKKQLWALKESSATNDFSKRNTFENDKLKVVISAKAEELITTYKSGFLVINDSNEATGSLLNVGVFGSSFRNVEMKVGDHMPEGKHVVIFTKRAIQGVFKPSIHTKYIPEAINQVSYMNEYNHVFGYGLKEVFENEVTSINQPVAAPTRKATKPETE